jgi:hypothetical protein
MPWLLLKKEDVDLMTQRLAKEISEKILKTPECIFEELKTLKN